MKSAMPGFGDRSSDQEIWDVLAYIKSRWPDQMRDYQQAVNGNNQ